MMGYRCQPGSIRIALDFALDFDDVVEPSRTRLADGQEAIMIRRQE